MSSNTRATRSRYSSPARQSSAAAPTVSSPLEISKSSGNDASRSFMQRWLEPSVQTKTSFEEAGLMRYGVLEGMAPLGTLPKAKKQENGGGTGSTSGVRKITLKISSSGSAAKESSGTSSGGESSGDKSAVSVSGNAVAGRKRAASPGAPTTTASVSSRRSLPSKATAKKKEDDDDYNPKGAQRKKAARRSQGVDKVQETEGAGTDQVAPPVAGLGNHSALSPGLQHYPTAWALRTLYDEKSEDPAFDSLVTDVLQQTANDDTLDEFSTQIGEKKRDGKGDNQDCYYFTPPSTTTTSSRFQPQKGKPAQYGGLVGDSEDEEEIEEPEELPPTDAEAVSVGSEMEGDMRAAKKAKTSHSSSASSLGPGGGALVGAGHSDSTAHYHQHNLNNRDNHNTENAADTPSRKRRRRNSASSDSSLSSAMTVPSPQQVRIKLATTGASSGGGAAGSAGGSNLSTTGTTHDRGATSTTASTPQAQKHSKQPNQAGKSKSRAKSAKDGQDSGSITKPASVATSRKRRQATSKATSSEEPSSPPPTSPITNLHSSRAHLAISRLAASSDLLSRLPKSKSKTAKSADNLSDSDAPMQQQNAASGQRKGSEELDATWNRRRDAKTVTNNYTAADSSVRISEQQRAVTPISKTRTTRRSLAAAAASASTRTTRSATKRPNDDVDRNMSPVPFSLTGDDASSTIGSRAVTPVSQRQAKRPKGLRVKSSPVKKSGGPAGGLPRLTSESQSSFRAGTPKDPATDNDEFCSACGNAGDVLCCDGCPRSFHFECVNLSQSEDLPDEWYCNECIVRRFPSRVPIHRGAFASALNNLEKSIPRAFSLPKRIQNRFEGVKAAPDGDYEEVASKPVKKRTGFDEMPDLFKQRDENQPVLCHACQKPSSEARAIIPCSLCPFYWHLDCLDPPLAVPPLLKSWKCPTHVDDVLAEAPRLAPAHKFRRVKNAQAIAPIFTRGTRNNGHIEIDWTDYDSEQHKNKLRDAAAGWPDPNSFGRAYKVSANGVILDFIEQLRRQGAGYGARQHEKKWVPYPSPAPQPQHCERNDGNDSHEEQRPLLGSTLGRTVDEMQASLNLIALKRKQSDNIEQLTTALLSQADENVLHLMARGNADNITQGQLTPNDELSLRATLAQMEAMSSYIRQLLGDEEKHTINGNNMKHVSSMPTPDPTAATPPPPSPSLPLAADSAKTIVQALSSSPTIEPKQEEMSGMMTMASLPEPTPPLTIDGADGSMDLD